MFSAISSDSIFTKFIKITVSVYTSEKYGSDETGDGSVDRPYKTILRVFIPVSIISFCMCCVDIHVREWLYCYIQYNLLITKSNIFFLFC